MVEDPPTAYGRVEMIQTSVPAVDQDRREFVKADDRGDGLIDQSGSPTHHIAQLADVPELPSLPCIPCRTLLVVSNVIRLTLLPDSNL